MSVSSTEADIVTLFEASRKCCWIRKLLNFLDEIQSRPTTIYEDNQACIGNVQSTSPSARSKHIDTQYFHTMDLEKKKIIKIVYCSSEMNLADILTKPLGPQRMMELVNMIGFTTE